MSAYGYGHQIRNHYGNWSISLFTSGQTAELPNEGGASGGSVWLKADAMAVTGELTITDNYGYRIGSIVSSSTLGFAIHHSDQCISQM